MIILAGLLRVRDGELHRPGTQSRERQARASRAGSPADGLDCRMAKLPSHPNAQMKPGHGPLAVEAAEPPSGS